MGEKQLTSCQSLLIDLMRIFAALCVVVGHALSIYNVSFRRIQSFGVIILFVLSGFLTMYSLERKNIHGDYTMKEYAKNRITRIGKGLLVALVFCAIVDSISIYLSPERYAYPEEYSVRNWIASIFLVFDAPFFRFWLDRFGTMRPLWSLRIEFALYILVGTAFLCGKNKKNVKPVWWFVLIWMAMQIVIDWFSDEISLAFLIGMIVYYLYDKMESWLVLIPSMGMSGLFILFELYRDNMYSARLFFGLGLLMIVLMSFAGKIRLPKSRLISEIAKIMYMLYLIHYTILYFIRNLGLNWSVSVQIVFGTIVSVLVSAVLYYALERREWKSVVKLISKFQHRKR